MKEKEPQSSVVDSESCASSKKLNTDALRDAEQPKEDSNYFLIVNFSKLKDLIAPIMICPECDSKFVTIIDNLENQMGFAHQLELKCTLCGWNTSS